MGPLLPIPNLSLKTWKYPLFRLYSFETMSNEIGIRSDINFMLTNIGWNIATIHMDKVYQRIVLDFLSFLHTKILSWANCGPGLISIRLFNIEHHLTLEQFNGIFGFQTGGEIRNPRSFNPYMFWGAITSHGQWLAGKCDSSSFRHPAIRIVHKFIASTVLGHGDSKGKVCLIVLLFIWAMMKSRDDKINYGAYLAKQLQNISNIGFGNIVDNFNH
ncbi:uncharacterized protein LOC114915799 [Cajanus cajan]|uniref:uncharacterized protein LOC114915799 n=1 Tax=Cajanus cajan TaxID=3821 RepID=UPI0010FB15C5|nr:uncharacterized protein LOC114915799 [Cajanus cajan]